MNKIASYLNEHLLGEVSSAKSLRKKFSTDASILTITPELVTFPRVTNDIRKIARFTWQLAEKGHVVPITARGFGSGTDGSALGKGVIVDTSLHLREIIQIAQKDKLVHLQPGVSLEAVTAALKWQGLALPGSPRQSATGSTIGGVIASNSLGQSGSVSELIERLEVVLANGDVIETGRVSRRDVNKKLGLQTFEGELYRKLEGIIEDNEAVIERLAQDATLDNTGYKAIADIRAKDGSFDLTPLFVGSQGTLGIISEVVLKTDFYSDSSTHAVIVADSVQTARDLSERLVELAPAEVMIFDGELYRQAAKNGVQFGVLGSVDQVGAVIYVRFNDFSERNQLHKLKKMRKLLSKITMGAVDSTERPSEEFLAVAEIAQVVQLGRSDDHVSVPVMNGAWVPSNRREEFEIALSELATKHHMELPVSLNAINGTYDVYPQLKLDSVGDKQKLFKLLNDYAAAVDRCNGAVASDGAEGRLKANAAWAQLDDDVIALYEQVRQVFDPFGTLNPGVKQVSDTRTIVAALRTSYESADTL